MMRISEESYERVTEILDGIKEVCEISDDYFDWEDMARCAFADVLDELDTDRLDMTCAAIRERLFCLADDEGVNFAKGVRTAMYGYLCDRRDFLGFSEYDRPEPPEDEDEIDEYEYELERFLAEEEYNEVIEKWIELAGKITIDEE